MNKDAGELQKRAADSRARALAPMVEEIRAAGFTSCRSMAGELNRRHVPTFSAVIARRMDHDPEAGRFRIRVGLRIRANTVAMAEYARAIGKEAGQHLPQRRTLLL